MLACFKGVAASSITLAWDPSSSGTVAGYKVYYGAATHVYTNSVDAGLSNLVTIPNLTSGTRYFFAATAVDSLGQESVYSAETNYVMSGVPNSPPTISGIANQSIAMDSATPSLSFTVGDVETPAASLTVSGSSGNSALVGVSGIVFGGAGSNRTVTVTPLPGASGSAAITVTVSDGANTASTIFQLSVINSGPGNTPPTITAIPSQSIAQDAVAGPIAFTISDNESSASSLTVTAVSSDQTLVPNGNIVLGGTGSSRNVTVTPSAGLLGTATITLTVSDGSASANTSFLLTVQSTAFSPAAASYSGLFYESNAVQVASAGSFKLSRTVKNSYSGQVTYEGKKHSVSGQLDAFGRGTNYIPLPPLNPLLLRFDCGTSNFAGVVVGSISAVGWSASLSADRLLFNSRTNPAPWAGSYTLVLPGESGSDGPVGHSYGTVKVTTGGTVSFAGTLADGTRVSQASALSKEGMWPFYASIYSSQGMLMSWLSVTRAATNVPDVTGLASWIKLSNPLSRYYPAGFTNQSYAAGAVYNKPATVDQHIVHLNKAKVFFAGGNLAAAFTNSVDIMASSKVVNGSTNLMSMSFSLSSGVFKGRVQDPYAKQNKSFGGVVLQKLALGYGNMLGTNLSSQVELTPP